MKTKRAALLTAVLVIALCAVLIVGAAFALFGKSVDKSVTVTTGDVAISAEFGNVKLFSLENGTQTELKDANGKFALGGTAALDQETGVFELSGIVPGDKAEIVLTIKNTSTVAVKYCVVAEVSGDLATDQENGVVVNTGVASGEGYTWKEIPVQGSATVTISVELPKDAEQIAADDCEVDFTVYAGQSNASDTDLETLFGLE